MKIEIMALMSDVFDVSMSTLYSALESRSRARQHVALKRVYIVFRLYMGATHKDIAEELRIAICNTYVKCNNQLLNKLIKEYEKNRVKSGRTTV
jgi:hypothetical protein